MFAINHAATALLIKREFPQAPMWLLLVAAQAMELLWVVFNFTGVEYSTTEATVSSVSDVHLAFMPFSHSIVSTLVVAVVAWLVVSKRFDNPKIGVAVSLAIASHMVLDLVTHSQDIALAPFMDLGKLGLGLYETPIVAFVTEMFYGIFCWWVYRGSKSLLAIIVGFNLANFTFFSASITGPEVLLADQPFVLTAVVFVQTALTLLLVGFLGRREADVVPGGPGAGPVEPINELKKQMS